MKKAILVVSFGTTYAEAEQTCIRPVEAALAAPRASRRSSSRPPT